MHLVSNRHPRRRGRLAAAGLALVAVLATLSACGVDQSSSGTFAGSSGGTSGGAATTVPGGGATPNATGKGVPPAKVPAGYRPLSKAGVGVGLAVPKDWKDPGISLDEMSGPAAEKFFEDNPSMQSSLEMFRSMTGDAELMAAAGDAVGGRREMAMVIQTSLSLPTIPQMLVDQMKSQLESAGGSDVEVQLVEVPGLDDGAKALDVSATMSSGSFRWPVRELMVPTDLGIAVVVVSSDRVTSDTILSTVGA